MFSRIDQELVRARSRLIRFTENSVIKSQPLQDARFELENTAFGQRVGLRSGLFYVPKVSTTDSGDLVFEKLTDAVPAIGPNRADCYDQQLSWRLGLCLAEIHRADEDAPADSIGPIDGYLARPVRLHGDFSVKNILCQRSLDRIAIIDWQTPDWIRACFGSGNCGLPYIDVANMIQSVFRRRPGLGLATRQSQKIIESFLDGYLSHNSANFSIQELKAFYPEIVAAIKTQIRRKAGQARRTVSGLLLKISQRYVDGL